jgi:hypothetical protein
MRFDDTEYSPTQSNWEISLEDLASSRSRENSHLADTILVSLGPGKSMKSQAPDADHWIAQS